jgi:hypothetical protein
MQLETFHSLVRDTAKRGPTLDDAIPTAARQAARALERRFTFTYMIGYYTETLLTGASSFANWSSIDVKRIKAILAGEVVSTDGSLYRLWREDERMLGPVSDGRPSRYWCTAEHVMYFNRTADEDYPLRFKLAAYTSWPTIASAEPAILEIAEDVMLYRTMMNLAPLMRDQGMAAAYRDLFEQEIKTLIDAQVEHDEQNTDHRMAFGVNYDEP